MARPRNTLACQGRGDVRTRWSAKWTGVPSEVPGPGCKWGCGVEYKLVTEAKAHHRKGPSLWGCEGKLQSSSPIGFKCSPGHRGLGVQDSKSFPRGFYWARLGSLLGNDMERGGGQRLRNQAGLTGRKQPTRLSPSVVCVSLLLLADQSIVWFRCCVYSGAAATQ